MSQTKTCIAERFLPILNFITLFKCLTLFRFHKWILYCLDRHKEKIGINQIGWFSHFKKTSFLNLDSVIALSFVYIFLLCQSFDTVLTFVPNA